jgi:hypothetical protein
MDAAVDEIQRAIEDVRSRHQHHARTDRDEAQRRTQLIAHCQRADNSSQNRRAEWLDEDVRTPLCQGTAQKGAGTGAREYQHGRDEMLDTEDH